MKLWILWWNLIAQLRPACSREKTFLWMSVVLIGLIIRPDILGVTSIIRAIGLLDVCYDRLLDFFHSPALVIHRLTAVWTELLPRTAFLLRMYISAGMEIAIYLLHESDERLQIPWTRSADADTRQGCRSSEVWHGTGGHCCGV